MTVAIPRVLSPDELATVHGLLTAGRWVDGRATAGSEAAAAKRNLQLAEDDPALVQVRELVLAALSRHPAFQALALPLRVSPPLINRHDVGMAYGDHVDNALRNDSAGPMRCDLSVTLFLSPLDAYDGGELVVSGLAATQRFRGPPGDLLLYPSGSIHRVEPVIRGTRLAVVLWVQSLVPEAEHRAILVDMSRSLHALRRHPGLEAERLALSAVHQNLLRLWSRP